MGQILTCMILCATGYEESSLRRARALLESYEARSCLLGLTFDPVEGAAGGRLQTGGSISQLLEDRERPLPGGLLLAGGIECSDQLMADPRVHLLMQRMLNESKVIGLLAPLSFWPIQALGAHSSQYLLLQDRQPMAEFMAEFMQKLKG